MSKRIGSLLLSLALCLSLLPTAVLAEEAQPEEPLPQEQVEPVSEETEQENEPEEQPVAAPNLLAANNGIAPLAADDVDVSNNHTDHTGWTAIETAEALNTISTEGNYYLTKGVELANTWTPVNGVVLCLNGHNITGADEKSVITINENVTFTLTDCNGSGEGNGKVTHNQGDKGRGVYVEVGTFNMYGGSITGNSITTEDNAGSKGGGVAVMYGGQFTMSGGSITGNTADSGSGGGVYVYGSAAVDNTEHKSSFTMSGSASIADNTAKSGGGVYVGQKGTFEMNSGTIGGQKGNKATNGGGVYVAGGTVVDKTGSFTMSGGSITGNTAASGSGGVYVEGEATFTMTDGSITGNEAVTSNGGGVYVFGGTFNMSGNAGITGNKANRHGGGVYVTSSGSFAMSDGTITGNKADASGGGVFVEDNTAFTMSGGSITGNDAETLGGGVHVKGTITVSGAVNITGNCKGGTLDSTTGKYTGGSASNVYLSNGKTIAIGTDGLTVSTEDTTGAKIGVTLASNYGGKAFTDGWSTSMNGKTPSDFFSSDAEGYAPVLNTVDGELHLTEHTHSWTYALSTTTTTNDTITATCEDCGASGGSVTIKAPTGTLTYDGSEKAATLTESSWQGDDLSIVYKKGEKTLSDAPTNAGTYTASITLGGATASVTYEITKATPEASDFTFAKPSNLTYDGSNKTAAVEPNTGITGMGDITVVKYYKGETALESAPTDAGAYTVKISVAKGDNYDAASDLTADDWKFTIQKADQTITVPSGKTIVKNGIGVDITQGVSVAGVENGTAPGTLSYTLDGTVPAGVTLTDGKLTVTKDAAAGTITIKVTAAETDNYNEKTETFTVTVVDKTAQTLSVAMTGWTYGGQANTPSYAKPDGIPDGIDAEVTYAMKNEDGSFTNLAAAPTNAGNYQVTVKYETDTEIHSGSAAFTIESRKVEISGLTGVNKEYDGTNTASVNCNDVTFNGKLENDELTYTAGDAHFSNVAAGTGKTVTVAGGTLGGAAAANYVIEKVESTTADITKKKVTFGYGYVGVKQYDGTATARVYEPSISGLVNGETLTSGTDYTVSAVFDSADVNTAANENGVKQVTITVILNNTEAASNYQWENGASECIVQTSLNHGITPAAGGKFGSEDGTKELPLRYTNHEEQSYVLDISKLPAGQNWRFILVHTASEKYSVSVDQNSHTLYYTVNNGNPGDTIKLTVKAQCGNYYDWTHEVTIKLVDRNTQTDFKFDEAAVTKTYGDEDFTFAATGAKTSVTYSSSDETVATVDNTGKVHILKVGTATISATASETAEYNEKTVSYTLTVGKKSITAPAADTTEYTYNGEAQTYRLAANDAYTITGNTQANANETGYAVTVTLKDKANTQWNDGTTEDKTYSFIIKKAAVTVTAKDKSAYVNDTEPALDNPVLGTDYTVSGLVGGDTLTTLPTLKYVDANGTEIVPDMTKTGDTIIRASGADAGNNYKITTYIDGKLTVSSRPSSGGGGSSPSYTVTAPAKTDNGAVSTNVKSAKQGDTVTVTVTPDKGYVLETLTVLDKNGKELKLTEKDGKYTFTMPASKVEIKATFMDDNTMLNYFVDVKAGDYFYDAVLWAAQKGITNGINDTEFGPSQSCTRAQIVTFLWRVAGAPEPKSMDGFSDVSARSYYAKAVAWAIENGITTGTGDGQFSPDATCTREQAVTFLYRASGSPAVSGGSAFGDVAENAYYADAVAWAEKNGVTEGIGGGLFGSGNDCTRAQIVTFLYRAYQGK